ncbi:MAG TPA: TetR/AcrR family transcriptional regulator, partial [Ktedonobacteraceae bacterium]|nr:TetR/AcrR family transcriptional regulator [Ktedonobacteraceae bacterium]
MTESESQGGKARDANKTRIALLNAAEVVFAQHGFEGARIEAIANTSGYNNSLIFRYFGDKLGLYTEVLKRADKEMSELLARAFVPLLEDETITSDGTRFKAFLVNTFGAVFDYMVNHPHFMRLINWEQAEGVETFVSIASHFEPTDLVRFEELFESARRARLVRSDLDVVVMVVLVAQICWSVLAALPLYQLVLGG